jgi:predicted secreted protein
MSTTVKITIESKPDENYQISLISNPTTGFTWEYVCENSETTTEITRTFTPVNPGMMGSPSNLIITFKSTKSDTIKFYQVRKWLNQKLSDLVPNCEYTVLIKT